MNFFTIPNILVIIFTAVVLFRNCLNKEIMETTVKQRLIEYLKKKGIGRNKFEAAAGISAGYITNLKNAPGAAVLVKILQAAPDLNRVWLLTGEGEMLTTSPASIPGVVRASELSESPPRKECRFS